MGKARECGCCRRELVKRDAEDQPILNWNARLRKWFTTAIEPAKFMFTTRLHQYTNKQKKIKVWACKCGHLNQEHEIN